MKKQLVIIRIIALLVCVGLSGCNEVSNTIDPEKNKFIGTWKSDNSTTIEGLEDTILFYSKNNVY